MECEWIDINVEWPEDAMAVLVFIKHNASKRIAFAIYHSKKDIEWIDCNLGTTINNVTHWCLIPEDPED